jgi:energy-coupling factor transporter ATP-binding protein EcfA2
VSFLVAEPDWQQVIDRAASSYFKLVLIIGPTGSGKTKLLKEVGGYGFHHLNFGEDFSRLLLAKPLNLRAVEAEEVAMDLVEAQKSRKLAIDNTEVLFENPIKLNPLTLLKRLSVDRLIVATLNARLEASRIIYGIPGHPSYQEFSHTKQDTFFVIPTESIL